MARVVHLGYADSGHGAVLYPDPPDRARFVRADPAEAAARLAAILREERADVLLGYDASGGYGHRDHVRVHEVGRLAAELAAVRLLEATMPRERVLRAVRVIRALRVPFAYDDAALQNAYTPRSQITHMVDARGFARQKRDALARHRSQLARGRLAPLARMLAKTPAPLIALLAGYEWYTEVQVPPGGVQKPESDRTEGSATMSDVFKSVA